MATIDSESTAVRPHATLVLVRHGESVWNRSLRLTGWADVPLSPRGREQARHAGRTLRERGIAFEPCFTSQLCRATETRDLLLAELGAAPVCHESWRLNERHYGALQGLHAWHAVLRYGLGAVRRCKREFDVRPPLAAAPDPAAAAGIAAADRDEWLAAQRGESLGDALTRFLPLWEAEIAPALRAGEDVLIVAHNNVLRGLIRHLDGGQGPPVPGLATGQPWVFRLDAALQVIGRERL
jgi:2,3-bisphosphoglycerate-dependent phosphoglycerate mutase